MLETTLKLRHFNDIKECMTPRNADSTKTSEEQISVEKSILKKFEDIQAYLGVDPNLPELLKEQHKKYLSESLAYLSSSYQSIPCEYSGDTWQEVKDKMIGGLRTVTVWLEGFRLSLNLAKTKYIAFSLTNAGRPDFQDIKVNDQQCLDASRPWLCYWILHPLALLGVRMEDGYKNQIAQFLAKCQSSDGGFGGGPWQYPHLAPTYAAVNALTILGTEEAYKVIDRKKLYEYLLSLKQPDGSFAMHLGGEIDIRGAYCALSVASLTGIMTNELVSNTAEWIVSCQTYEGGFAGCPGLEAHGGYAFCGLAALVILNKSHLCDSQALLRWLVQKQMKLEGGFQGRTNKLVDSCYSFWQGGAFPLIYTLLAKDGMTPHDHLFDERALQEYILICCQNPQGGMVDKPGKARDVYHTCYTISGLSIAQHFLDQKHVLGTYRNELASTHPLYNIRPDLVRKALIYFHTLGAPTRHGTT